MLPYLAAFVHFVSALSLDDVARLLSTRLFGGIPFVGREEYLRDEVPALRLEREVLGLDVVVHGFGGDEGYTLDVEPHDYPWTGNQATAQNQVDLTAYVRSLLVDVAEISLAEQPAAEGH
jgi:hypothetical protein